MNIDIQWPLVIFGILCGMGGTLACSIGVAELTGKAKEGRFVAAIVSMVLLVVGGLAVVAHLSLPLHAFYAVTNVFSFSGISLELIMLVITFVVVFIYALVLKREVSATVYKVLAVLSIIAGLLLAFVCGHGYVIQSREFWDTELVPLSYLGTVMPAGAFLYVAIASKVGATAEDLKGLKIYVAVTIVVSIITSVGYLVFVGADVAGRNPLVSYGLIVVCGVVGEIACLVAYWKTENLNTLFIIAIVGVVLAILCALGVRLEMWLASDPYFYAFYWELGNGTPIGTDDY